ncbi:MAG: DUF4479 and tRNA-binding domain-containing protein [Lactobacillus sp.]|nr:DUF4479 and tRNA-binding domain-containing protein [Lactobacillus sp.]
MITCVNKTSLPKTLIVILGQDNGSSSYEVKNDVTRVLDSKGQVIGFNFFNIDQYLDYDHMPEGGQVKLSDSDLSALNKKVKEAGFDDELAYGKATLVYGLVETCESHPDSDHLHVCQVNVGDEKHQIVCGAPNIAQGQTVVVALPGTLMPNGAQIWPGELRGVDSYGMICSARELGLPHAEDKRGIISLPAGFKAGDAFEPTKVDELLASGAIKL